ncbi:MAG: Rieske 2Fe-2S domain-containing protein [Acidobacteriota bacterium]
MGVSYQGVQWNRQKRRYDLVLLAGVLLYLACFLGLGAVFAPRATAETMMIRAFGTGAFLLLHIILSIGPLARLDRRFAPLLYNRRHLGVTMFILAFAHGALATLQFHGFGDVNPLVSLLTGNPRFDSLIDFPFQPLGFAALIILFLMAATSHDFWLANLTAPVWKALHMLVYVAYGLIVLHVVLGVLQQEQNPALAGVVLAGALWVFGLHVVVGMREKAVDVERTGPVADGFVDCGTVADIPDTRARVVTLAGERVAIFKYGGKVSAISNVCRHQNGPLGEGKIVDGCVVCPWHGYQYRPDDGASPPPFTEKVPTFRVRVDDGRVWVDPQPLPAGTRVEPARIEEVA